MSCASALVTLFPQPHRRIAAIFEARRERSTVEVEGPQRSHARRTIPPRLARGCRVNVQKRFIDIGDEWIEVPQQRKELWPSFEFSKEEAIQLQLDALKDNNKPYPDHGVEILYRFSNLDPFQRSEYFGRSLDLGQFERFRRVMHTPYYQPLLDHVDVQLLSSFEVNEFAYKQRLRVTGTANEQRVYEITMIQRLGGRYDGYWFTDSLICEEGDWSERRLTGI